MNKRSPAWMVEEWRKQGFSGQTHRKALFGEVFQAMPGDGAVRSEQLLTVLLRRANRETHPSTRPATFPQAPPVTAAPYPKLRPD